MIMSVCGKNHILNLNFITCLQYRSVFGRSVIDCKEDHELIGLLWCAEGKPGTFEDYVKKVVQDKDLIQKCLILKTILIDPGKNEKKTDVRDNEDFNFENGILKMMQLCGIPAECIHYCTVKDLFELVPKTNEKRKMRIMTEDEITASYYGSD